MSEAISKVVNGRIKTEIKRSIDNYDEITCYYLEKKDIQITFKRKNNVYVFSVPPHYPFAPPKLTINGLDQQSFFNLASIRFTKTLIAVSGIDCLCCDSYLCYNNWNAAKTMNQVIEQIEKYKTFKYLIFVKILIEKIKEKYLHRWIDLESWFY